MEIIIQPLGAPLKERRKLQYHKLLHMGKLLYPPRAPLILSVIRIMS